MEKLTLCRRVENKLVLDYENLTKIQEIKNFDSELPVAFISIIGEPESGKTTFTNLVIQNLKNNGGNGWLDKIDAKSTSTKIIGKLPGFSIWSDSKEKDEDNSEIILWPEAFNIKRHGNKTNVLLLHLNYSLYDQRSHGKDSLEVLLALLSSRFVEIIWKQNEFRCLDIYHYLGKEKHSSNACNSVVYLFRKNNEKVKKLDREAKKWLEKNYPNKRLDSFIPKMKSLGISHVPDSKKPLQTSRTVTRGYLELSSEMYNAIYDSISLIVDDEYVFPKNISNNGKLLTKSTLHQHFNHCVQIVGKIFGFKPDLIEPIDEVENDNTVNNTQGVVSPGANAPPPPPQPQPTSNVPPPPPPPPQPTSNVPPPPPPPPNSQPTPPPLQQTTQQPPSSPPQHTLQQPPTSPPQQTVQQPPTSPPQQTVQQPPTYSPQQTIQNPLSPPISSPQATVPDNPIALDTTTTDNTTPICDATEQPSNSIGSVINNDFLSGIENGRSRLRKPTIPTKSDKVIEMTAGKPTDLMVALNERFKKMHTNNDSDKSEADEEQDFSP